MSYLLIGIQLSTEAPGVSINREPPVSAVGDIALKVDSNIKTDLIDSLLRFSDSMANLAKNLDIPSVYKAISECAVHDNGIVMGWLGLVDENVLQPVAFWGDEAGYLEEIKVSVDDSECGRGPGGTAYKSQQPSVVNSIEVDSFAPWREQAFSRGYRSVAALPVFDAESNVFGVLLLYSNQESYFSPAKVALYSAFARAAGLAIQNAMLVEQMERHAQRLEQAVLTRTEELNAKNQKLEEANLQLTESAKYKVDLLASMSHDLRSPLTAILGFAEVLQDELYGPLNDKQKEHSQHIWQAGHNLMITIDDVLELSRVEAGLVELEIDVCYPKQIVEAAISLLTQSAVTAGANLSWTVDPSAEISMQADGRRLKQAIFNLAKSFIKAAGCHGSVEISAKVISQDLAIDLVWTSPLDTITATTNPATGFGFSLAQHLIKLHGGSGFYDNPPGVAGRYRMLVPLHPSTPTDDSEFS